MRAHVIRLAQALAVAALLAVAPAARAGFATWDSTGTVGGSAIDVTVTFQNVGSDLNVTLFNNSKTTDSVRILSGLVWDITGTAPSATNLMSAVTGLNSDLYTSGTVHAPSSDLRNSTLGGQKGWEYATSADAGKLNVAGHQYQFGLGASGLGGTFGGLGNASYGIAGPLSSLGTNPLQNQLPLVMNTSTGASSVAFVIHNFTGNAADIKNVLFMFGSAGTDNASGHLRAVPEPSSIALVALGSIGALVAVRRKRRVAV